MMKSETFVLEGTRVKLMRMEIKHADELLEAAQDTPIWSGSMKGIYVLADAISYINDNYKNKITLEQLSSTVNMSPFYFSRMFKKETGYSPYEYIIIVRINEAKRLLKGSDLLIKEIAYRVGFNSESRFVTSFRKNTELSPTEFRNVTI